MKPGSEISIKDSTASIYIEASALNPQGMQPVEIVVNGKVVATGNEIKQTITIDDSAWIAARTEDAHSNPIFVNFEDRQRGFAEEALDFVQVTDRLQQWVQVKALFENDQQKETVLTLLEEGRAVYEDIIARAEEFERMSPYINEN